MRNANDTLEALVLRCQIGDAVAFEELFKRFQPRLRYFLRRLDQTGADTDDLLQDIWLRVLRGITKLRDPIAFPVWLYKIARNRVYRKSQQKRQVAHMAQEELILPPMENKELNLGANLADKVHRALTRIQPFHREVLTLHFLEQMSYESIAVVVGCSLGTVKSRMHHAKQSLRKELERENE